MELRLETSHHDLEQAIGKIVAALATERGVTVKETRLELTAANGHVLDFRVTCEVRAMIVSATLIGSGRAEIGDDLCARIVELGVEGSGMVANLARAAIEPRIQELRGRAFPLGNLKLPGLKVAGVEVTTGESVRLCVRLEPLV